MSAMVAGLRNLLLALLASALISASSASASSASVTVSPSGEEGLDIAEVPPQQLLEVDWKGAEGHRQGESEGKAAAIDRSLKVEAIVRSVLAGLSTSLGAGIVLLLKGSPTPEQMAFALALAAAVMLTVSLLEMWLPQLLKAGRRLDCFVGALVGLLGFLILKWMVPEPQMVHHKEDYDDECESGLAGTLAAQRRANLARKGRQWQLAMILTLALTAHNFPEGLAVAVSSLQSERLGFVVMAAIAVHNIPEGIAIAMPVLDATGSRWRAMQLATLSGLAEPLGALLAVTLIPSSAIQGRGMDALLCVIGGIMSSVALTELLPEAQAQGRPWCTLFGLLAGVVVMLLTHELA